MNSRVSLRLISRYLFWSGNNKTLSLSRRLTTGAIMAAVAAFMVALAISEGFEREMERVLTGFGPHIIVFERDLRPADVKPKEVFTSFRVDDSQTALWRKWRWLVGPLELGSKLHVGLDDLLWRLEDHHSLWSPVVRAVHPFRAADWLEGHGIVPTALLDRIAASLQLAQTGIVASAPFVMSEGLALAQRDSQGEPQGVIIKGFDAVGLDRMGAGRFEPPLAGWQSTAGHANEVYVGRPLLDKLGGDKLRVLLGDKITAFHVVGTFATGLYEYDNRLIIGRVADVAKLPGSKEHGFDLWLDDPAKGRHVARLVADELGSTSQVLSWDEIYDSLFRAMASEKMVFGILMSVLLALCCFQVLGELLTFSWEKRASWGLWRGLGLKERGLKRLLYGRGLSLTILSLAGGIVLGAVLVWMLDGVLRVTIPAEIYFVDHIPGKVAGWDLVLVVVLTLFFAGWALRLGVRRVVGRPIAPLLHKGF